MNLNEIFTVIFTLAIFVTAIAGSTKMYENHLIKKSVDTAIKFADMTGKTGKDKLVRAVTFIENLILSKVPIFLRPLADFLINPAKIVTLIERQITKIKQK